VRETGLLPFPHGRWFNLVKPLSRAGGEAANHTQGGHSVPIWASLVVSVGRRAGQDDERTDVYEYKVVEVREKMIGGKMSGEKLEKLLNQHGSQGWQLKSITAAEIKGRIGPGGVEGLLVTFERGN
jgi:hypothetical protein